MAAPLIHAAGARCRVHQTVVHARRLPCQDMGSLRRAIGSPLDAREKSRLACSCASDSWQICIAVGRPQCTAAHEARQMGVCAHARQASLEDLRKHTRSREARVIRRRGDIESSSKDSGSCRAATACPQHSAVSHLVSSESCLDSASLFHPVTGLLRTVAHAEQAQCTAGETEGVAAF